MFSVVAPRHRVCPVCSAVSVGPIANTNPFLCGPCAHGARVHPDRVVVPTPKPHDAPPGVVPFHRFLESLNQIDRAAPHRREPTPTPTPAPADAADISRAPDPETRSEKSPGYRLLPTLGDLPAPDAPIETPIRIEQVRQQVVPATGRLLDLYI